VGSIRPHKPAQFSPQTHYSTAKPGRHVSFVIKCGAGCQDLCFPGSLQAPTHKGLLYILQSSDSRLTVVLHYAVIAPLSMARTEPDYLPPLRFSYLSGYSMARGVYRRLHAMYQL